MAATDEPEEDGDEATDADRAVFAGAEAEASALDDRDEGRKWLRTLREVTETVFNPDDLKDCRVYFAYRRFLIAAFERAARICQSDLPTEQE